MQKSTISIIAAIGKNRELGKDNKLLWHIPEDLKRFKEITYRHPIIMGRKTFESIGRILPNRLNIVITRDREGFLQRAKGLERSEELLAVSSLEQGIREAKEWLHTKYQIPNTDKNEIFIIGGGQIFEQSMPRADKLYLTIVDATYDADVYFPDYSQFSKVVSERKGKTEEYSYMFVNLEKLIKD